jgi:outer membrane autotransporter protein
MKKVIFSSLACLVMAGANAQFNQGTMLVGGDVDFYSYSSKMKDGNTTVKTGTQTSFGLSPRFGYFVIDKLAVGASVNLSLSKYDSKSSFGSDNTSTGVSIGPFVRYYFDPGFFVQGSFGVGATNYHYDNVGGENDVKYRTSNFGLGVGYAYFLNDNIAIEPMIGYASYSSKTKGSDAKDINSQLYLSVGFQIYLRK